MSELEELVHLLRRLRDNPIIKVENPSITIYDDGAVHLHGVGTYRISQILPVLRHFAEMKAKDLWT
jgi:hypothetical protein